MAKVFAGRYTAQIEGDFVVFIIGMRINQWWAIHKWLPVVSAMGPMLTTLYRHPEKGFLGAESFLYSGGPMLLQYWRSFEDLERFARSPSEPHLEPWRRFNKAIGNSGSVGIFHETYLVKAGQYECVYGNMPRFGLAKAGEHVPAKGNLMTARQRLGQADDAPPIMPAD